MIINSNDQRLLKRMGISDGYEAVLPEETQLMLAQRRVEWWQAVAKGQEEHLKEVFQGVGRLHAQHRRRLIFAAGGAALGWALAAWGWIVRFSA